MGPQDRKTVERDDGDGWKHRTTYDRGTSNQWSVDVRDTGVGGVGSNWSDVKGAHHTNQNDNSHDDNVGFGEST